MGLWIITVEAYSKDDGRGWYFDAAVIADTKKGAKSKATRAVAAIPTYLGAKSLDAVELDVYHTGVILVAKKEAAHAD
jgi:hypothetical protein